MASAVPSDWDAHVKASLESLSDSHLLRALRPIVPTSNPVHALISSDDLRAWAEGAPPPDALAGFGLGGTCHASSSRVRARLLPLRLFGTNDYLGLSSHPAVREAVAATARQCGMGPRSSALVCGFTQLHRDLETELARLKGCEDALLFPTGYAANVAVLAALAGAPSCHIFSDQLNHASIIDGARLAVRAGATVHVYRHCDAAHLEQLLRSCPEGARKLVVTDGLFSMDGDFAPLAALAALRARFGFLLVVDEAHSTLVCGARGGGAAEMCGVSDQVDIHVGTLSKAFGCVGGFVACAAPVRSLLMNRGRGVVFSTALPLPVVAGALAALRAAAAEGWRRAHVWGLAARVGAALRVAVASPIVPLVVGGEEEAVRLSALLLRMGVHVPAIRPPTVPRGTARLRLSLSAAHTVADVDALVAALRECNPSFRPLTLSAAKL